MNDSYSSVLGVEEAEEGVGGGGGGGEQERIKRKTFCFPWK